MSGSTVLDRIDKVDFFAVLPAGFYVFMALWCVFLSYFPVDVQATSDWPLIVRHLGMFLSVVDTYPASLLLILFGVFLLGSLVRSIPVQSIESCIPDWTGRGLRLAGKQRYPYPETLKKIVSELELQRDFLALDNKHIPSIDSTITQAAFNHFKDLLCITNPDAFSRYQTFESRSRFFAGMFFAGCVGLFSGLTISFVEVTSGVQVAILSSVLISTFGFSLRRVRKQEASALLSFVIALKQIQTVVKSQ